MQTAIDSLFNHPTARRIFLNLRYALAFILVMLVAYYSDIELMPFGFVVSMFGQVIQLWSFASLIKNEKLTARGPYVLVRNPMYLGRYFLILGFLILTGSWWVVILYTVFYWFYMSNRVRREEKRLAQLLGAAYAAYRMTVNRFLPNFVELANPAVLYFNFAVLRRNNGHWNLLATLAGWLALDIYLHYFARP